MSAPDSPTDPDTHYRLAGALILRTVGTQVIAFGLLLLLLSVLVGLTALPLLVPVLVALLGLVAVTGTAWWLRSRAVVTLTTQGYAVGLLRGAGVRSASWPEVKEVVTTTPRGVSCVVLRLETGEQTTLPVAALAADREEFVRDLQRRLQSGHGLQRL